MLWGRVIWNVQALCFQNTEAYCYCRFLGGLIVLAITPFVMRFASLTPTAMHYLKYMLLINSYYIMGSAVNTTLIAGVFRAGGDTKFGLICDTIDMWVYAVPLDSSPLLY